MRPWYRHDVVFGNCIGDKVKITKGMQVKFEIAGLSFATRMSLRGNPKDTKYVYGTVKTLPDEKDEVEITAPESYDWGGGERTLLLHKSKLKAVD